MAKINIGYKKDGSMFSVNMDEPTQENVTKAYFQAKASGLVDKPLGIEKQKESNLSRLSKFITPVPTSGEDLSKMSIPFPNEKIKFLEESAPIVKKAVQESIGNIGSNVNQFIESNMPSLGKINRPQGASPMGLPQPKREEIDIRTPIIAGAGALASSIVENAPFSPSEFSLMAGGEVIPTAKPVLSNMAESMANRFAKTSTGIGGHRLDVGANTVGREILDRPELISGDKKTMYNKIKFAVKDLSNQIGSVISKLGKSKNVPLVTRADMGDTRIVQNVLNEISPIAEEWADDSIIALLQKARRGNDLNLIEANKLREFLGDFIGKRFESMDVPEKIGAIRNMYGNLRNKIGELSPELDNILTEQHNLIDIKNSLRSSASKGYKEIPKDITGFLTSPLESNIRLAQLYDTINKARGIGVAPSVGLSNYERNLNK